MPRAASRRGSRHLFDRWAQVAPRLKAARRIALFLDFDGTLVPLRPRPQDVWLDDSVRHLLRRLAGHPHVTVSIVSGRRLADLRRRARVPGIRYVGLHGWEQKGEASSATASQPLFRRAMRQVTKRLEGLTGMRIEDKGFSFAVHYRGAPTRSVRSARPIVFETMEAFKPRLRLLEGKKVWEVLPREVEGKGAAVRALLAEHGGDALPIYMGDDTTDESAFAALRQGITVRVGSPRPTKARFYLRNAGEVQEFLRRLEAEIE